MKPYYERGGIRLYLGDCRDVLPALGESFDCAIADPPYGETSLEWDVWPDGWIDAVGAVTRSMWCFGSLRMFFGHEVEFIGWRLSQDIIWEKHNGSNTSADRFRRVHEQTAHFYRGRWDDLYHVTPTTNDATARTMRRKQGPAHWGAIGGHAYASVDGGPRLMRSVIYARSMNGRAENETQKPEAIVAPLVGYSCPPSGVLLAPFAGSGTDLVVALMTGRRAVGVEVRESQCEKAARRLSALLVGVSA